MDGVPGIDKITEELEKLQSKQEKIMLLSSQVIKNAGKAITLMHAHNLSKAKALIQELSREIKELSKIEKGMEYYTQQAHQEYVEAMVFYSIISGKAIPSKEQLNESAVAYLLGIMDVVGELKREAFDELIAKNRKKAEEYYSIMKGIYDSTLHIRFANSIMPGFRKKQDTARIQLESVAAELL